MIKYIFICCLFAFITQQTLAQTVISSEDLQKDFAIMKQAYKTLHPGIYRFTDSLTMDRYFDELEGQLNRDMTREDAYLTFSHFLARIQCGHTYANFWNQPDIIKKELFFRSDKLPFTTLIIGKRLLITQNASDIEDVPTGTEILNINGISVANILDSLIQYVKADGSNDGKRLDDLQISGYGDFESFDVYYSLLYGPQNDKYMLEVLHPGKSTSQPITVNAITRDQRKELLKKRYGPIPGSYDELWEFRLMEHRIAYLKLGTFVTWKMEMNWKKFLKNAFKEMNQNEVEHLILDIRGNEGGMDEVNLELSNYLLKEPIELESTRELLRYEKIPEYLEPYLDTWDNSFKDRREKVKYVGNGFYTWNNANTEGRTIKPGNPPFQGKIYLLMGPANSSATFFLSKILKEHKVATLVGQESGGNLMGTNGGQLFFLNLPHSQIEMDIPLIGYYPMDEQPDQGIMPDVYVTPSIEDVANGVDTELEEVKNLILEGQFKVE